MPTSYNAWISFTLIPSFSPEAEPRWLRTCKPNLLHPLPATRCHYLQGKDNKLLHCTEFARPLVITLCLWQQMWQRYINLASEAVISPVLFLWSPHLFLTQWCGYMTSTAHIRVWLSLEKYVSLQHFVFDNWDLIMMTLLYTAAVGLGSETYLMMWLETTALNRETFENLWAFVKLWFNSVVIYIVTEKMDLMSQM